MVVCWPAVGSSGGSVQRPVINQQAVVDYTQVYDQRPVVDLGQENGADENTTTNGALDLVEVFVYVSFL